MLATVRESSSGIDKQKWKCSMCVSYSYSWNGGAEVPATDICFDHS